MVARRLLRRMCTPRPHFLDRTHGNGAEGMAWERPNRSNQGKIRTFGGQSIGHYFLGFEGITDYLPKHEAQLIFIITWKNCVPPSGTKDEGLCRMVILFFTTTLHRIRLRLLKQPSTDHGSGKSTTPRILQT